MSVLLWLCFSFRLMRVSVLSCMSYDACLRISHYPVKEFLVLVVLGRRTSWERTRNTALLYFSTGIGQCKVPQTDTQQTFPRSYETLQDLRQFLVLIDVFYFCLKP